MAKVIVFEGGENMAGILPVRTEDMREFAKDVMTPVVIGGAAGMAIDYALPRIPYVKNLPTTLWSALTMLTGVAVGAYYLAKHRDISAYTIGGGLTVLGAYKLLSELLSGVIPTAGYGRVMLTPRPSPGERIYPTAGRVQPTGRVEVTPKESETEEISLESEPEEITVV